MQLIFMDQIEDVSPECIQIKGEQSIILRKKGDQEKDAKVVLTCSVRWLFLSESFSKLCVLYPSGHEEALQLHVLAQLIPRVPSFPLHLHLP